MRVMPCKQVTETVKVGFLPQHHDGLRSKQNRSPLANSNVLTVPRH